MKTVAGTRAGLTGNQLKILAMVAMTCDHVGLQLLPQVVWLRWIGRLAMPIYAFMIAEGCRHTRSRKKYLLRLAAMAALCQLVYFFALGSLYQCILVTFSLSVCLIWSLEEAQKRGGSAWFPAYGILTAVFFLCVILPDLKVLRDFDLDYGLWGVFLPVFLYFGRKKWHWLTAGLVLLALDFGGNQWLALLTVPILMCYNGRRGTANIGKLFYWYYPLHLVVIYGISLII